MIKTGYRQKLKVVKKVEFGVYLSEEGHGDKAEERVLLPSSRVPEGVSVGSELNVFVYRDSEDRQIAIYETVTIYDAETRRQNFGMVNNSFIRVVNQDTGEELVRYDLGEDYSIETAVVVAEIYRNGAEWKFAAIGSGFSGGLQALCQHYGVNA